MDAKLYAQTDTSSQNVSLLLRRQGYSEKMRQAGEKQFFPLTGVGYVVLKVTPGLSSDMGNDRTEALAAENRGRLEHILHMSNALQMLSTLK